MKRNYKMTEKNRRTLIFASICGTMLATYSKQEKSRLHQELELRVAKGIRKIVKKEQTVGFATISLADRLWKELVDKFAKENLTIDASVFILELASKDEKNLAKQFGMGTGILGRWSTLQDRQDALKLEQDTRTVVNYLLQITNKALEIEEKNLSFAERLAQAKATA